jgi:hypothetical protein
MREVKAEIDKSGKVRIEFIGFEGDECIEECERLRKIMHDLGVILEVIEVKEKTPQQILNEIRRLSEKKAGERLGVT